METMWKNCQSFPRQYIIRTSLTFCKFSIWMKNTTQIRELKKVKKNSKCIIMFHWRVLFIFISTINIGWHRYPDILVSVNVYKSHAGVYWLIDVRQTWDKIYLFHLYFTASRWIVADVDHECGDSQYEFHDLIMHMNPSWHPSSPI